MDRSQFIGASDISAVLGMNPWKTPLQLWAEKTGRVPTPDLSDNEPAEWGRRLERVVSAKFAEKNGVKLIAYKKRFVHPTYEFLSCELDNIIAGTDEIVEIKTCNASAYKEWKDKDSIPQHYVVQVMMQLGLSQRKVGHIAVLCGGQKYLEKKVLFDQAMYDTIVERAVAFWKMVQDRVQPEAVADDNETILNLFPTSNEVMQSIESLNSAIAHLQEVKMHIKGLEDEKAAIEASLKQIIGEAAGVKTSQYVVTWKEQSRAVVDTAAMKMDGVYEGYTKESKTRVLRINKNKGE